MENWVQDIVIGRDVITPVAEAVFPAPPNPPTTATIGRLLQYPSIFLTSGNREVAVIESSTRKLVDFAAATDGSDPIRFASYIPNPNTPSVNGWKQSQDIYARKVHRVSAVTYHGGIPYQLVASLTGYASIFSLPGSIGDNITFRIHDPYTFDKEKLQLMKFTYVHRIIAGDTVDIAIRDIVRQINSDKRISVLALPMYDNAGTLTHTPNVGVAVATHIYLVSARKSHNGDMLQSAEYLIDFTFKASMEISRFGNVGEQLQIIPTAGWITTPYAGTPIESAFVWNRGHGRWEQVKDHEYLSKSYEGPLYERWQIIPWGNDKIFWQVQEGTRYDTIRVHHFQPRLIESESLRDMPILTTIYMENKCMGADIVALTTADAPTYAANDWLGIFEPTATFVYVDGYNFTDGLTGTPINILAYPISFGASNTYSLPSPCPASAATQAIKDYLDAYINGQALNPSNEGLI